MTFILFAHTDGDDLIGSSKTAVASSERLEELEALRDKRADERQAWLDSYGQQVPGWAMAGLVDHETIEEVPGV